MKNKGIYTVILILAAITCAASVTAFFQSVASGMIVIAAGLSMIAVYVVVTLKRFKEIAKLSDYLYKICNGLDALDIRDNKEGELSILKNNIGKTTLMLRSQAELMKKDKIWLSDSLADISHQLKTPITSILVMTDLLMEENISDEKRREFLINIEHQTEKMQRLVVTLLKLSKFDAGTISLKKDNINLKTVAENAVKPFLVQMELKSLLLDTQLCEAFFIGDYDWTLEAIENIIKNCVEHMSENDTLTIATKENPIYTELIIKDTGCGIDKEDLPHIFERFYKGKNSSPDSVGIGLALSKSVLSRENAKIEVQSEKGTGTAFSICFYKNVV